MLLEVRDLEVAYGDYQVVWGVSLSVGAGESVALLGPNGSGKSTVVNTISGLLAAKAGEIRFDGASLKGRPTHVRASLGIAHVLERRRVFPHLSVLQNLTLGAWHAAAKAARPRSLERIFRVQKPARAHPFRRRAADARARPWAYGASAAAHRR
jgi:branched-chain amino acid transport system ATP-binding protein